MGGGAGGGHGGGGAFGWGGWGGGQGFVRAFFTRRRASQQLLQAVEADLSERGLQVQAHPVAAGKIFGAGFVCGLLLGLLIGLIFWELT